jgi:hypothetical protein
MLEKVHLTPSDQKFLAKLMPEKHINEEDLSKQYPVLKKSEAL